MTGPWGCPTCGGFGGHHDQPAHGDWPVEDEGPEFCGCPDIESQHTEDDHSFNLSQKAS